MARFVAVVAIAMAAGHLVQSLAAQKSGHRQMAASASQMPVQIVQLSSAMPAAPTPALIRTPHVSFVELASTFPAPVAAPVQSPIQSALPEVCAVTVAITPLSAGQIDVEISAPCHKDERLVLRHAGLSVTERTEAEGTLSVTLPAMTSTGIIEVRFADGTKVQQGFEAPDAAGFRRFAVQWQGGETFALHGLENGADLGQPGDMSRANLGDPQGAGGYVMVLGDSSVENPLLAEVYTYPRDPTLVPDIVVEAAVTETTCGHDALGDVLTSENGQVKITDLTLAMPDCTGVGDFLVLKNLATNTKIAAN